MKSKFINPIIFQSIKETNYNSVLYTIEEKQRVSRTEISNITALSPPTVTNICEELLSRGLITEIGTGFSCGGRKPVFLEINSRAGEIIGLEVGKNLVRAVVSDLRCNIVSSIYKTVNPQGDITDEIISLIKRLLSSMELRNVLGIGVALNWTYDNNQKRSIPVHDLKKDSVEQALSEAFNLPVFVDKAMNLTLLAESSFYYANKYSDMIYLNFDESIEAGIIANSSFLRGSSGTAGELAHITVDPGGQKCFCGKNGCFHTLCSIPALIQKAIQGVVMGQRGAITEITEGNLNNINEDVILKAAKSGDSFTLNLIDDFTDNISVFLNNLILLFDPELIILGGKINKFKDAITDALILKMNIINREMSKDVMLNFSHFEVNLAIKGACKLALLSSLSKFTVEEKI